MKLKLIFLMSFLTVSSIVSAQFEIQGIIRPRFEFRDGYSTLRNDTTTPAAFVSQKSRLNLSYKKGKLQTKFSLFDFRVWGDQVLKKDVASLGLHEAWANININDFWSLKFGRQELKYDNNRLISPVKWNQIGASYDALIIKYRKNNWTVDLGTAWNQSAQNKFGTDYEYSATLYKSLNFLWLSNKFENFTISSLNILDGNQDTINPELLHFRLTSGIIPEYKNNNIHITARIFGQTGQLQSGQDINAFYSNIDLTYDLSEKINLTIGNEIISGNDGLDSLNLTSKAFDILYGGRHKFNGRIDYFSIPATTKGAGLIDSYLKADYKFSTRTSLMTEYHYFMLQNKYVNNGIVIDKFLGHEIDFVFKQKFTDNINLEAGYSFILGSESLEIIKDGNKDLWNHWFYLMLTVNPTLFKSTNN